MKPVQWLDENSGAVLSVVLVGGVWMLWGKEQKTARGQVTMSKTELYDIEDKYWRKGHDDGYSEAREDFNV